MSQMLWICFFLLHTIIPKKIVCVCFFFWCCLKRKGTIGKKISLITIGIRVYCSDEKSFTALNRTPLNVVSRWNDLNLYIHPSIHFHNAFNNIWGMNTNEIDLDDDSIRRTSKCVRSPFFFSFSFALSVSRSVSLCVRRCLLHLKLFCAFSELSHQCSLELKFVLHVAIFVRLCS